MRQSAPVAAGHPCGTGATAGVGGGRRRRRGGPRSASARRPAADPGEVRAPQPSLIAAHVEVNRAMRVRPECAFRDGLARTIAADALATALAAAGLKTNRRLDPRGAWRRSRTARGEAGRRRSRPGRASRCLVSGPGPEPSMRGCVGSEGGAGTPRFRAQVDASWDQPGRRHPSIPGRIARRCRVSSMRVPRQRDPAAACRDGYRSWPEAPRTAAHRRPAGGEPAVPMAPAVDGPWRPPREGAAGPRGGPQGERRLNSRCRPEFAAPCRSRFPPAC